jgi:hypothetical protein
MCTCYGATLYEILTGRAAVKAEAVTKLLELARILPTTSPRKACD